MQHKNSQKIAQLISEFIKEEGLEQGLEQIKVYEAWDSVVGERGAKCTTAKFYSGKILYCTINSSMVRSQLYFRKEEIVKGINKITGQESVSSLVLK